MAARWQAGRSQMAIRWQSDGNQMPIESEACLLAHLNVSEQLAPGRLRIGLRLEAAGGGRAWLELAQGR